MARRFSLPSFVRSGLLGLLLGAAPLAVAQDEAAAPAEQPQTIDVNALLEQGQQAFTDGDYETAAATFSTLVTIYERNNAYDPIPRLLRAKAYTQLEEYEAAIEDLKVALQNAQARPGLMPEILNTRGEVYMEVEAYQLALPDLQQAVQENRSNLQYQFNLGKALVKLGGAEAGEEALTKYLDGEVEGEEDQKAEALRLRGLARGQQRQTDAALEDIEASLAIEPSNYEAFLTRASIFLLGEDYAAAAENLQQAIEFYEPKDENDTLPFVQGYLTLASAYEELGKYAAEEGDADAATAAYADSLTACEELLDALPEDDPRTPGVRVGGLFRRGVAQRLLGELSDAVRSFSQALEIDPSLGDAYFRRGICFHYLGEEELAIRDFEQAASINFDSPRANLWKGMSWAKLGDFDEAIRAYGESVAVSDRYTPAYVNRGLAHLAQGDFEKAIADLNEAIRLQPTEPLHHYRRGRVYSLAGIPDKAIQSFMNAISLDGQMGPAYASLVGELRATGQGALAAEYERRAAELGL